MSDEPILLFEVSDHICTLTLNRPAQFNALSESLLGDLVERLDQIAANDDIRVVILAANGKAFCAGHDLKQMRANPERRYQEKLFSLCSTMMQGVVNLPQPVIARVQGMATAAGCQLVATCDLAVATEHSQFAVSGINLGLFCSTPAVALSRNVPRKRALQMLLTGEFIDAQTALDYDLINQVVAIAELEEATLKLASTIAAKPPRAVRLGKKMFYQQLGKGLDSAYGIATDAIVCNMMMDEAQEGIDAFIEKRPPNWQK